MTRQKSLNIPAMLVHTMDNNEYRVHGTIVGINEAKETVSMKFKGYRHVEHNIPMSHVYINEGILDNLKKAGKKVLGAIKALVKKVRGFLVLNINDEPVPETVFAPINFLTPEYEASLPGVQCIPSRAMAQVAAANGIELAHSPNDIMEFEQTEDERNAIDAYWLNVMKEYASDDDITIDEAVNNVRKKYNALNEVAILQTDNPKGLEDLYGQAMGIDNILDEVQTTILAQLERNIGDTYDGCEPLLIWGAPGIGKTMCLKKVAEYLKEMSGGEIDLFMKPIGCDTLQRDDWGIPSIKVPDDMAEAKKILHTDIKFASAVPKAWLPVYTLSGNEDRDKAIDEFYNTGSFQSGNTKKYTGGILFLDEVMRIPYSGTDTLMRLIQDGRYEDMVMASKWCIIGASNRFEDLIAHPDVKPEQFMDEMAKVRRWRHVTFVPDKEDWLHWARQKNKEGKQNVQEIICEFIEASPDNVFYPTYLNGGYDGYLDKKDQDFFRTLAAEDSPTRSLANVKKGQSIIKNGYANLGKNAVNPARHVTASSQIEKMLKFNVFFGHPELYKLVIDDAGNIIWDNLKQALNALSPSEWERCFNKIKKLIPAEKVSQPNNRLGVIQAYIGQIAISGTYGAEVSTTKAWDIYNKYQSIFTPDIIASIWETGEMPNIKKKGDNMSMQQDDNTYYPDETNYAELKYSSWKAFPALLANVANLIIENYPGGISAARAQIIEDHETMEQAPELTEEEFRSAFNTIDKQYSVNLGGETVSCLFTNKQAALTKDLALTQGMVRVLTYSKFAQQLANVAYYISKCCLQIGPKSEPFFGQISTKFNVKNGSYINALKKSDSEVASILNPSTKIMAASISASEENNSPIANNQVSDEILREIGSMIIWPAHEIFSVIYRYTSQQYKG